MRPASKILTLSLATAGLLTPASAAFAYGDFGGGSFQRGEASSYINPDTGAATANNNVNANSSCFNPDQLDTQAFTKNVHNDACFLDYDGTKLDGPASFQSFGVGVIAACPDPDNAGPKVAIRNAAMTLCFQSGNQNKGVAGDGEFHARLNNSGTAGRQVVVWCSDSDRDGCDDEYNKDTIRIDWSADGTATFAEPDYDSADRWGY